MTTWDVNQFNLSDSINREIWELSSHRGAQLLGDPQQARYGGLQDLVAPGRLPWVPDIVGRRCSTAETVRFFLLHPIESLATKVPKNSYRRLALIPVQSYADEHFRKIRRDDYWIGHWNFSLPAD